MKLRHKTAYNGYEFDDAGGCWDLTGNRDVKVYDKNGELHIFKREVLEPVRVQEEWENVPIRDVTISGVWRRLEEHLPFGHPDVRFAEVNGVTVLQRRKA